jgi:hypothetical protein
LAGLDVASVAEGNGMRKVVCEMDSTLFGAEKVTDKSHPYLLEGPVVEVVAAAVSSCLDVGAQAGRWGGQVCGRIVERARFDGPKDDVLFANAP